MQSRVRSVRDVIDNTSPTHEGFQVWNALPIPGTSTFVFDAAAVLAHGEGGEPVTPKRLGIAVRLPWNISEQLQSCDTEGIHLDEINAGYGYFLCRLFNSAKRKKCSRAGYSPTNLGVRK